MCAAAALDLALSTVDDGGAITLFHVIEIPETLGDELAISDIGGEARAAAKLEHELRRVDARDRFACEAMLSRGYAGAEILEAIDADQSIDLVVVGSNGRTGLRRAFMGSVAEKVARHARCPVLVARGRT